jgi:hypothetical protein
VSGCLKRPCASDLNTSASDLVLRCAVSGKVTPQPASWRGWRNRPWSRALFGAAISPGLTSRRFVAWWTCSVLACPASRTPAPGSNADGKMSGAMAKTATGLSRTSSDSWPSVVPPWCSSRTCLPGFVADGFDQSERDYADWVTHSKNRSLSLRKRLARATSGSGSSSWPTVRSHEVGDYQNQTDGTTQPTLCGIAHQWPTPAGSVAQDGEQPESWLERRERLKETANNGNGAGMPLTIASQLWPSPRSEGSESCGNHPGATDSLTGACKELWASPNGAAGGSTSRSGDRIDEPLLGGQVKLWTTPTAKHNARSEGQTSGKLDNGAGNACLATDAKAWQTPSARDHKSGEASEETLSRNARPLNEVVLQSSPQALPPTGQASPNTSGRRLNPAFVCWLMAMPHCFWTRAEPISSGAAATASFRSAARSLLSSLCGEF